MKQNHKLEQSKKQEMKKNGRLRKKERSLKIRDKRVMIGKERLRNKEQRLMDREDGMVKSTNKRKINKNKSGNSWTKVKKSKGEKTCD